ncbi:MAG: hypothetical protein K2O00_09275 [Muribaculaceae bacterium]|nr:hypothetical protein [Muribaculaceae bacterium]
MKKSTKYLIFLAGSFIVVALVIPFVLWLMYAHSYVQRIDETQQFQQEIPFVDQEINSIYLHPDLSVESFIIRGVSSTKDQRVEISYEGMENPLPDIDFSLSNSTLQITNLSNISHHLDSVAVYIANAPERTLSISASPKYFYNSDSFILENLNFNDLNITGKTDYLILTNCAFPLIDVDYLGYDLTCNFRQSEVGDLKIKSKNDVTIYAAGCVRDISVSAKDDLRLYITGYEGEFELQKNGNRVFVDRD